MNHVTNQRERNQHQHRPDNQKENRNPPYILVNTFNHGFLVIHLVNNIKSCQSFLYHRQRIVIRICRVQLDLNGRQQWVCSQNSLKILSHLFLERLRSLFLCHILGSVNVRLGIQNLLHPLDLHLIRVILHDHGKTDIPFHVIRNRPSIQQNKYKHTDHNQYQRNTDCGNKISTFSLSTFCLRHFFCLKNLTNIIILHPRTTHFLKKIAKSHLH